MAAYFLDSSAIVKRYVVEVGTAWLNALADPSAANRLYVVRLSGVEVVAAVSRRLRRGSLSASEASTILGLFRQHLAADYRIMEINDPLINEAMNTAERHALRAYDAVQLAAVLALHRWRQTAGLSRPTLVSSDTELNSAAIAAGLTVEDPNDHP